MRTTMIRANDQPTVDVSSARSGAHRSSGSVTRLLPRNAVQAGYTASTRCMSLRGRSRPGLRIVARSRVSRGTDGRDRSSGIGSGGLSPSTHPRSSADPSWLDCRGPCGSSRWRSSIVPGRSMVSHRTRRCQAARTGSPALRRAPPPFRPDAGPESGGRPPSNVATRTACTARRGRSPQSRSRVGPRSQQPPVPRAPMRVPAGARAAERTIGPNTPQPPRRHPARARHA
jgi:hypothetical protein